MAAQESYPDDLKYHAEHDWARIENDEAVADLVACLLNAGTKDAGYLVEPVRDPETIHDVYDAKSTYLIERFTLIRK